MTSDHSTPRCLRCPDTALRLIDRGAFAVSRDAAPLPAAIRDSALTVEVWVCPICRRIELRYPEELPLPEPPEKRSATLPSHAVRAVHSAAMVFSVPSIVTVPRMLL